MENAKELRSKKANVKSKLMGAVSMLVVSAIMLSSTTYAWFTLSTAPEVSGMSTTVGANGSLEVALLDNATGGANIGKISSGVGTSSSTAGKSVTESNITWGNIVSLSDESYGLQNVTLYPSVLNATTETSTLLSRTAMLKYAQYGTDGRVATLAANTAAGKKSSGSTTFIVNNDDYGVRAIGSTKNASEESIVLAQTQANYATAVSDAKKIVETSLDTYKKTLSEIAMAHGNGNDSAYNSTQVEAINNSLDAVASAVDKLHDALKWAKVSDENKEGAKKNSIENVEITSADTTYYQTYQDLNTIKSEATAAKILASGTTYTWSQISEAYQALMDTTTMTFKAKTADGSSSQEYTVDQIKTADSKEIAKMLLNGTVISIKGGKYSELADYTGEFSSGIFAMHISAAGREEDAENSNYTVIAQNAGKLNDITSHVRGLSYVGDGDASGGKQTISTTYGYVVDLAFQTSMEGDLQLSDAKKRVSSDTTNSTQGTGSFFTFADTYGADAKAITLEDMKKAAKALRVVFVDKDQKILAVAGIKEDDVTSPDTKKYALHVYSTSFTAGGGLQLGDAVSNDKVATLTANTPTAISAIVYMDGEFTDSAMNGVTGTLDLQFCSSAQLEPMNYTGYVNGQ